jgi:Fur family iron response transcriptional regulator
VSTEAALSDEELKRRLSDAGLRATRQRMGLFKLMTAAGERQFTAEMLQEEARAAGYRMSLATVYNTLKEFSRVGFVHEVAAFGSRTWFDTQSGSHCHYYCRDDDTLLDAPSALLEGVEFKAPEGYHVARVEVVVQIRRTPTSPPAVEDKDTTGKDD